MVDWEAENLVKKKMLFYCFVLFLNSLAPATPFFSHTFAFFEQGVTRHVQQEDIELDGELTLFTKLRKVALSFVTFIRSLLCQSARDISAPTGLFLFSF